jgi:hypothetical protein
MSTSVIIVYEYIQKEQNGIHIPCKSLALFPHFSSYACKTRPLMMMMIIIIIILFVRLLALRPLLAYCSRFG